MTDYTALCAKLRGKRGVWRPEAPGIIVGTALVNPDGPAAADMLEAQAREIAKWKERALEVEDGLTIAYMQGASAQDEHWRPKLTAAESRIAELEKALREAHDFIVDELQTREAGLEPKSSPYIARPRALVVATRAALAKENTDADR